MAAKENYSGRMEIIMTGKKAVKAVAIIAAVSILFSVPFTCGAVDTEQVSEKNETAVVVTQTANETQEEKVSGEDTRYFDYKAAYSEAERPEAEIDLLDSETVLSDENGNGIQKDFEVKSSGLYAIEITFKMTEVQTSQPAIAVKLNGELPFYEASQINLPQLFTDADEVEEGDVEIPESVLVEEYQTRYFYDTLGCYGGLLEFYIPAGTNKISITPVSGELTVKSVKIKNYQSAPAYKDVKDSLKGEKYDGEYIKYQAEKVYRKSDSSIFAINDRSSAWVEPTSAYERYLNAIGGTNWQDLGQYLEWEFEVPEDGLYTICVKYRKDTKAGLDSNRRIYIDGEIPYAELENYTFGYTSTFVNEVLSTEDGEEMLFYLEAGKKHTIKMEVSIGDYSSVLPKIYAASQALQACYRQFIMVMGTAPDSLRDYQLDKLIPDVLEDMTKQKEILLESLDEIEAITGESSSGTGLMMALIDQIEYFEEDSYYIAGDIQSFKTNIASVITWVLDVKVQPLKIDYFAVCAPDGAVPKATQSKWGSLKHTIKSFLYTFAGDYEYAVLDTDDPDILTVWDPSGATEFSIWRQLVQYDFAEKNPDIKVNFKNVSTGFQQAFLAGMLPDVYVGMTSQSMMEFAFRKSCITDITSAAEAAGDDINEALKNYNKWIYYPAEWEGKLYGFPMGVSVPVLFYRTDILEEMNLDPPETWEDLIYVSSMLQKKNLEVGIAHDLNTWKNMIYQAGGRTVDDKRTTTYLMDATAIDTFTTLTSLFTEYSAPVTYSALDRFRTGEMPVVVSDLVLINSLDVLAPEISGKWDFTHYPATVKEDGTLDYTVGSASGTYMVITNRRPEMATKAWEFIKWRSSTETLVAINRRLEMSIGRSVRAVSPNREAQDQIPWSKKAQRLYDFYEDWRYSEPEVPGDYFISRAYNNAWTAVYYQDAVPGDALKLYIPSANAEIVRRREYFGMDDTE